MRPLSALDSIHHSLRATAFDLPDFARDCLLGAEVLGIQDPIDEMELGRAIIADLPPSSKKRLASRPQSGVWSDELPRHRRAPPPPPSTPTSSATEEKKEKKGEKKEEVVSTGKDRPDGQRRHSHRRSRPSYPPISPSQRARELVSTSRSPPRDGHFQPSRAQPFPRPPSPRPASPTRTRSPPITNRNSILDRPHPAAQPRSRSISPPSSILITPTEATFVIPFPVPRPTPPQTPTQKSVSRPRTVHSPTPTQKTAHAQQRHSLHSFPSTEDMKPPPPHLLKLASSPGKRPVQSQFSALVLVKSNTPSIYDCEHAAASRASLPGTSFPSQPGEEGRPVPQISITAPTPSSPRFSFSALFPPSSPRKPKQQQQSPLSPQKMQKRPPRQRRVSAEASQWAWGAKRTTSPTQQQQQQQQQQSS